MRIVSAVIAVFSVVFSVANAQTGAVDQFLNNPAVQDEIISEIVPNHTLMSKLIDKLVENRSRHEMLVQHLTNLLKKKGSTYAGLEAREIKALSETDIKGLMNGEGIGLALPAELNRYPGPRHALDMAEELQLTGRQKESSKVIYDRMHSEAVMLGKKLIDMEREMDEAFASGTISLETLKRQTSEIGRVRAQLRYVHLAAHVQMRELLTPGQIESYDRLRGYRQRD